MARRRGARGRRSGYTDYHWLIKNKLAQGGYPDPPEDAFEIFDVVVFCAEEAQPRGIHEPPGKHAVFVPMDDNLYRPIDYPSAKVLDKVAAECVQQILMGRKVLSSCWAGANRSGLVSAMTLMKLKGMTGSSAVRHIQKRRKPKEVDALANPMFVQFLQSL